VEKSRRGFHSGVEKEGFSKKDKRKKEGRAAGIERS
jgi:hypothetical protein